MVSQAKYAGLDMIFQGSDDVNNIYLFSNNLYQVSIYLRHDQKSGMVEIKQKEFLNIRLTADTINYKKKAVKLFLAVLRGIARISEAACPTIFLIQYPFSWQFIRLAF